MITNMQLPHFDPPFYQINPKQQQNNQQPQFFFQNPLQGVLTSSHLQHESSFTEKLQHESGKTFSNIQYQLQPQLFQNFNNQLGCDLLFQQLYNNFLTNTNNNPYDQFSNGFSSPFNYSEQSDSQDSDEMYSWNSSEQEDFQTFREFQDFTSTSNLQKPIPVHKKITKIICRDGFTVPQIPKRKIQQQQNLKQKNTGFNRVYPQTLNNSQTSLNTPLNGQTYSKTPKNQVQIIQSNQLLCSEEPCTPLKNKRKNSIRQIEEKNYVRYQGKKRKSKKISKKEVKKPLSPVKCYVNTELSNSICGSIIALTYTDEQNQEKKAYFTCSFNMETLTIITDKITKISIENLNYSVNEYLDDLVIEEQISSEEFNKFRFSNIKECYSVQKLLRGLRLVRQQLEIKLAVSQALISKQEMENKNKNEKIIIENQQQLQQNLEQNQEE
ncbi:hypothetical protein PPERSA_05030 [Pseudocohnilembus persalinus]|uniref:Uncharacterized protein n=1 Tax=Pseudocohnilembus persalinus TaxID=266149 RepID=A0A0V0QW71_PSEPJ|nr:hypothetical protein PPERSA_05030 [Pseudocohnilembus persalinus]|eukprot:KRX06417.1 hypothetical protein PPERSA_05030 [Pseudocohnilembus persalinus]